MKKSYVVKLTNLMLIFMISLFAIVVLSPRTSKFFAKELSEDQIAPIYGDEENYLGRAYNPEFDLMLDDFQKAVAPTDVTRIGSATVDAQRPYYHYTYTGATPYDAENGVYKGGIATNADGISVENLVLELRGTGGASINDLVINFRYADGHDLLPIPFTELKDTNQAAPEEFDGSFQQFVISLRDTLDGKYDYTNLIQGSEFDRMAGFHLVVKQGNANSGTIDVKRAYLTNETNPVYVEGSAAYINFSSGWWHGSNGPLLYPTALIAEGSEFGEYSNTINFTSGEGYRYLVARIRLVGSTSVDYSKLLFSTTQNEVATSYVPYSVIKESAYSYLLPELSLAYTNIVFDLNGTELSKNGNAVKVEAGFGASVEIAQLFYTNLEILPPAKGYPALDLENARVFDDFDRTKVGATPVYDGANPVALENGFEYIISYAGLGNSSIIDGSLRLAAGSASYIQYVTHTANPSQYNNNEYRYLAFQYKLEGEATLNNLRFDGTTINDAKIHGAGTYIYANDLLAGPGLPSIPAGLDAESYPYVSKDGYQLLIIDLVLNGFGLNFAGFDLYYGGADALLIDSIFFVNAKNDIDYGSEFVWGTFDEFNADLGSANTALAAGWPGHGETATQWWGTSWGSNTAFVLDDGSEDNVVLQFDEGYSQYEVGIKGTGEYFAFDAKVIAPAADFEHLRFTSGATVWVKDGAVIDAVTKVPVTSLNPDGLWHSYLIDWVAAGLNVSDSITIHSDGQIILLDNLTWYHANPLPVPYVDDLHVAIDFDGVDDLWWGVTSEGDTSISILTEDVNNVLFLPGTTFTLGAFASPSYSRYLAFDVKVGDADSFNYFRMDSNGINLWFKDGGILDPYGNAISGVPNDSEYHKVIIDLYASFGEGDQATRFAIDNGHSVYIDNIGYYNEVPAPLPYIEDLHIVNDFDGEDNFWWQNIVEAGTVVVLQEGSNHTLLIDGTGFSQYAVASPLYARYLSLDVKVETGSNFDFFRIQSAGEFLWFKDNAILDPFGNPITGVPDDGAYHTIVIDLYASFGEGDPALRLALDGGSLLYVDNIGFYDEIPNPYLAPMAVLAYDETIINELTITSLPTKVEYIVGQEFSLDGLTFGAVFDSEEVVIYTPSYATSISAFDPSSVGTQTITVSFGSHEVTFEVTLIAKTLSSITVTPPTKVSYYVGESLNLAGLVVVANYNDASTVTLTPGSYTVSGYNPTVSGPQTVTVTYQGQTSTFVVNVSLVAVSSVVIYFYPNKLVYHVGAELDLTGLVVVAYYNNGDEVSLNDTQYVVSGYNAQTVGKQTITITFNGQSDTFEVTVTSGPVGELDHLTITSEVTKKTYVVGEELDLAGLVVKAVYEDETAVTLSSADYTVSGYDKNTTGAQIITVTYGNKTATFTVSVNAAPAQSAIPGWVIPVIIVVVVLVGGGILAFFILKKGFKKDQQ